MSDRLKAALEKLRASHVPTLEELFTGREYFGITTATPLQRAICRIADGLPLGDLENYAEVARAVGKLKGPLLHKPDELDIVAGIRGGKSLLAAAMAIRWALTCDISRLGPGETARVSIVSLSKDLSDVIFGHLVGNILARPRLSALLVDKPGADTVLLRHPSGAPVEIKVVAGSRAGASLVARWSAGCIFDEATRMVGQGEGVINYDDARAAVRGRLLPGAQLVSIGSPWAPYGPIYEKVRDHWGSPSDRLVVIKAPGWDMNPVFWTPERCDVLKVNDPDVWLTDCAAEFATPEEALFNHVELDKAVRKDPIALARVPGATYIAYMDPATRGNAWTLCIATRIGSKRVIAYADQWVGNKQNPLNVEDVLRQIADVCKAYGCSGVYTDLYMGDALQQVGHRIGFPVWPRQPKADAVTAGYMALKHRFSLGELEYPDVPHLREDLARLKKRTNATGGVSVLLPLTSDGRHCDYAPSFLGALSPFLDDVKTYDEESVSKREEKRILKDLKAKYGRKPKRLRGTWGL